jgi:hypothetical protein
MSKSYGPFYARSHVLPAWWALGAVVREPCRQLQATPRVHIGRNRARSRTQTPGATALMSILRKVAGFTLSNVSRTPQSTVITYKRASDPSFDGLQRSREDRQPAHCDQCCAMRFEPKSGMRQ